MESLKPTIPRGMRDFLPEQMLKRRFVMDRIKMVFERYGYQPLETPAVETIEVLSGKCGEEGDQLLFKILKRGTGIEKVGTDILEYRIRNYRDIIDSGLRYDLTVPFSRVVAMYQDQISLPFKRYQMQPVWRADRPQKGRYREFYQCDADVVGTAAMMADAEIIAIINDVLIELGFKKFKIRINNRKILTGIVEHAGVAPERGNEVCIAIDKLEKIGLAGVKAELQERQIPPPAIEKILPILEMPGSAEAILDEITEILKASEIGSAGVSETRELFSLIHEFGIPPENYTLDLHLARGLEYYTGPIYESVVEEPKIGSLTGGGRYDELVGMFLGKNIPATGTTIGIERIIDVMTELNMMPEAKTSTKALVTIFSNETKIASLAVARSLRKAGMNAEIFYEFGSLKKQFSYADKKGIPFVIILGPDEIAKNVLTLKNLSTGEQQQMSVEALIDTLKLI